MLRNIKHWNHLEGLVEIGQSVAEKKVFEGFYYTVYARGGLDGIFPLMFRLTSPHRRKWAMLSPRSKIKESSKGTKNIVMVDYIWHILHKL